MIDFSDEVNFLKPEISVDFNHIKPDTKILLNLLEKKYQISSSKIELFNGFSSSVYSILKFFNKKFCFIYSPCNLEYKKAATNLNYEVRTINRFENLALPIKENSVVVFANPSYLDGTYYDLDKLLDYWSSKNATVLIDETLLDFCGENASVNYLDSFDNIYILKDFSKYYSNKDLKISTIFSSTENIKRLKKFEPDEKISVYDIKYLEASLKDNSFRAISNSVNIKNRLDLEKSLHACKYVNYLFHSSTNSLLIRLKNITAKEFQKKLEDIKFSNCLKYDYIDEYFLNIYVNSKENTKKLKEFLNAL